MKLISLVGRKFGRLTVLRRDGTSNCGDVTWDCLCECGARTVVVGWTMVSGASRSCGCLRKEVATVRATTHGESGGTTEYSIWLGMKNRCYNRRQDNYPRYGGRGIRMSPQWRRSYIEFRDYIVRVLGRRPSDQHSIDRIDNNGNYEPGNIRWATRSEQRKNRRDAYVPRF